MKVTFYGTRGSIPICDKEFQQFGGNTTCIQLKTDNKDVVGIFDAGTGIRKLGMDIYKDRDSLPKDFFIVFSHFHWDHIQGFPFFDPAYDKNMEITFVAMGKDRNITDLKEVLGLQMKNLYFPVQLENMGAKFHFVLPDKMTSYFNVTKVTSIKQNHPGGSYGYRIEREGKVLVICTDLEHADGIDQNVVDLAKGADLLIHEAQYTSEQLKKYKGWGHSSYEQAIQVAEMAGVKQLALTHHDPNHDDDFLKKMEKQCQDRFPDCVLARENMEFTL